MTSHNEFVDYVVELMSTWMPVVANKTDLGYGLFRNGWMFALIADEQLYFKTVASDEPLFEREGCSPYFSGSEGRAVRTSYWSAPPACLDTPAVMREWCQLAYAAALRVQATKAS